MRAGLGARFWALILGSILFSHSVANGQSDWKKQDEAKNKALVEAFLKLQDEGPPGFKKLEIKIDKNSETPYSDAVSGETYWLISKMQLEIQNWKRIEKLNAELLKDGKSPIEVDQSKENPYTTAYGLHQQGENKKKEELFYTDLIQDLNAGVVKIGKPPIAVDLSLPFPYAQAYRNHSKEIQLRKSELGYFEKIENINASLKKQGKPQIVIDQARSKPYESAYVEYTDSEAKRYEELHARVAVEKYLESLKNLGKPVRAKLDESKPYPYKALKAEILKEYPNVAGYDVALTQTTRKSMTCDETWDTLISKFEKRENGSQQCEADKEIQKEAFFSAIAKALVAAKLGESEEQIRARETETLRIIGDPKQKIELHSVRPGFKDCGLSLAEHAAIISYTASFYADVNKAMRSGDTKNVQPVIDTLNSALKKLAIYKGEVRRGVDNLGDDFASYQPGAVIQLKSFTSTTLAKVGVAEGLFKFVIETCSGRYIAPVSSHYAEEEVLLPPGAKMKVISSKEDGIATEFKLEEICE